MKINSTPIKGAALLAFLVGLSPVLSAETRGTYGGQSNVDPSVTSSESTRQQETSGQKQAEKQEEASLRRSSAHELTGMDVKNRSGDTLGKVKDFVIDAHSGQVVYAVVGSGGVLGVGETLHAVPVTALNYDTSTNEERLTLDIDSARWSQAPRFRKERLSSLQADQEGKATYEYYGQTWRGAAEAAKNEIGRNLPGGRQLQQQLVLSSDLKGKNVRSGDQKIGEIEDVLVQLENHTAAALLDPDNDFAGTREKYIVPFNKFIIPSASSEPFGTSLTRQDFASAQMVQGDSWAMSGSSGNLFIWPGRGRMAGTERVAQSTENQAQNQMNQPAQSKTPQPSAQLPQQQPPVAQIRQAIQSDTSLAQQGGRDIQVVAQGDKVVLLGTVQTKEAKDRIEERVEKAAPGWSIQNEIRVANVEE